MNKHFCVKKTLFHSEDISMSVFLVNAQTSNVMSSYTLVIVSLKSEVVSK